jgi:hypothetical protein
MLATKNTESSSSIDEKSDGELTPVICLSDIKKRFGYGAAVLAGLQDYRSKRIYGKGAGYRGGYVGVGFLQYPAVFCLRFF